MENNPSESGQSPIVSTLDLLPTSNRWFWSLIIGGVVLVLLIAGGLWWWMRDTNPVLTPTATPSAIISPDLATWKTYRNYGFEIKYPESWQVQFTINTQDLIIHEPGTSNSVSVLIKTTNSKSVEEWFEKEFSGRSVALKPKYTEIIAPVAGIKYSNPASIGGCGEDFTFLIDETIYMIQRGAGTCDIDTLFDQIFSTFKFTNQTTIEYKNTEYGFSLALPATWKGYAVTKSNWRGESIDPANPGATYQGPQLTIKNPKGEQWQPVPILVFTPEQWQLVVEEKLSVSAAPIGPSKLGQNTKYVFALPPRWVGFTDFLGQEEALVITKTFKIY
ncbi:MAG: hypothetical protein A3I32_03320 [Candidatus Yanofskybacteria bacterium RIFCSPLOWO2_02_FULL_45_10]|uniref:Uncharacterized protein n=2 Tax=Candidatus Yanofskyibacteriota TaxID=1752733 RepID=A0A1F8G4A3_9BACT|nr:MAG: hypothetical protein A3F25_01930 [Candidatus Yanofskybacteria bacterium RIFCSPHIGHO2_12_FULL_45_19b]OGN32704.1 MAG: hypothetical protein A3I32_03320 [Candidatus Yanofskybacteria bacterium RIFCSPLOWO2_02_FULL_45_10]